MMALNENIVFAILQNAKVIAYQFNGEYVIIQTDIGLTYKTKATKRIIAELAKHIQALVL